MAIIKIERENFLNINALMCDEILKFIKNNKLTEKQGNILMLAYFHQRNLTILRLFNVCIHTIESHRINICKKLDLIILKNYLNIYLII